LSGNTGLGFHPEIKLNKMVDGTSMTPPRRNMTQTGAIVIGTGNKPNKTFV
jgi:hypothetical protein